jgi:solute carrier family 50 (sugar transporter)
MFDWLATISTICFFSIGWKEISSAIALKDGSKQSPRLTIVPYAAQFFNCALWTLYGLTPSDANVMLAVVVTNGIGLALSLYYMWAAIRIGATDRNPVAICALSFLVAALFYCVAAFDWLFDDVEQMRDSVGNVAALASLIMIGAPLADIGRVVANRDASSISLRRAVLALATGALWLVYGLQIDDLRVIVPNAGGTALAVVQLALLACCSNHESRRVIGVAEV